MAFVLTRPRFCVQLLHRGLLALLPRSWIAKACKKDRDDEQLFSAPLKWLGGQVLNGKTKMGTDATAAAGPGATAASASDADILTYGRAEGLFAGVSLGGSSVEPDNDANHRLYGKTLTATDIVRGTESSQRLMVRLWSQCSDSKLTMHD